MSGDHIKDKVSEQMDKESMEMKQVDSCDVCEEKRRSEVSLLDLPWEDITFQFILPELSWNTLFRLRCVSHTCKEMIKCYFSTFRHVDIRRVAYRMNAEVFKNVFSDNCMIVTLYLQNSTHWLTDSVLVPVIKMNSSTLNVIDLTACSNLSVTSLHYIGIHCRGLKKLVLKDCHWVGSSMMCKLARNCRRLQHIDLTGCWGVDDEAVTTIVLYCPQLNFLSLAKIYGLTDRSMEQLRLPNLVHLNIQGCWRITNDSIRSLGTNCPKLETLQVRDCSGVSETTLARMRLKGIKVDKVRNYKYIS